MSKALARAECVLITGLLILVTIFTASCNETNSGPSLEQSSALSEAVESEVAAIVAASQDRIEKTVAATVQAVADS